MSFIGDLFGGKEKQTQANIPTSAPITYMPGYQFQTTTGYGGGLGINPNGGSVQVSRPVMDNYGKFGNLTTTALGRTGQLIGDLKGNANPYIAARVRPLQQSLNERRMDLSRGMSRRGVTGSLANNELIKFDTAAQRELADQRALATNDTLNALYAAEGLDRSVRGDVLSLADSYLKTSLSELGLSLEGLQVALSGSERQATQPMTGTQVVKSSGGFDLGSILGGVGAILGAGR